MERDSGLMRDRRWFGLLTALAAATCGAPAWAATTSGSQFDLTPSLIYDANDGSLMLETGFSLSSIKAMSIQSASGALDPFYATDDGIGNTTVSFINTSNERSDSPVTTRTSGWLGLPDYLASGLSESFLLGDLTFSYRAPSGPVTTLFGDLVYIEATETEPDPNEQPIAAAGGPYEATLGESLVLDAYLSYDPDSIDGIISFDWDLDNDLLIDKVSAVYATGFASSSITLTSEEVALYFPTPGTYTIRLSVTSGDPDLSYNTFGGIWQQDDESRNLTSETSFATVIVTAVPEPASAGLLGMAALVALGKRRRGSE